MDHKNKKNSPKESRFRVRQHPSIYLDNHLHLTRAVVITANLLIFWAILPPFIHNALLHGLLIHRYMTSMLLCFCLLALSLLWSTGQSVDAWIFLYFNFRGERPLWLDRIMLGFTQLGNGLAGLLIALILFLAGDHPLAYEFMLGTLALWLVVEVVKAIVHRSRPYIKLMQARIVGSRPRGRSFPSGHTSQSFFTATLLFQHFHLGFWIAFSLYILALLVAITRMYVGAHYPRDIMAGAILGSVWGALGGMVDTYFFAGI